MGARSGIARALAAAVLAVMLVGCGDGRESAQQRSAGRSAQPAGQAITAHYDSVSSGEMGSSRFTVVAAGVDQVRVLWSFPDDDPPTSSTFVYDGDRILVFGSRGVVVQEPYMLHEVAKKHPEEYDLVTLWVFPVGSDEFEKACPDARKLGTKKIAGRTGLGFRCGKAKRGQTPLGPGPVWLDQTSGLVLQAADLTAVRVTTKPVDAVTFSTEPPPGVKVKVVVPPK